MVTVFIPYVSYVDAKEMDLTQVEKKNLPIKNGRTIKLRDGTIFYTDGVSLVVFSKHGEVISQKTGGVVDFRQVVLLGYDKLATVTSGGSEVTIYNNTGDVVDVYGTNKVGVVSISENSKGNLVIFTRGTDQGKVIEVNKLGNKVSMLELGTIALNIDKYVSVLTKGTNELILLKSVSSSVSDISKNYATITDDGTNYKLKTMAVNDNGIEKISLSNNGFYTIKTVGSTNYYVVDEDFNIVNGGQYFKFAFNQPYIGGYDLNRLKNDLHVGVQDGGYGDKSTAVIVDNKMNTKFSITETPQYFRTTYKSDMFIMSGDGEGLTPLKIYKYDGTLVAETRIEGGIRGVEELDNGNIIIFGVNDYYHFSVGESEDEGNNGGGESVEGNIISSVIFLPEGSSVPVGFNKIGGEVYKKEDGGHEIKIYIIRYTPPATIGNINIQ